MADAVEHDPVGVRQPLLAEARRRRRPRQQPVLGPPHDADRALDALRVEQPVEVARGVQQRHRRRAGRDAEQLVDEQLRRDVLVVGHEQLGRAAAALRRGEQRVGVRRHDAGGEHERPLHADQPRVRVVAGRPAAGRRERDDRARPAALGELQRDEAAERVAGQVRGLEAGRVHGPLDRVGQRRLVDLAVERGTARVAGERDRQDVVAAFERGQDELPGAPGVDEAVQAHERRPGAAAMGRREPRHLASTTEVATCRSGIDQ